MTELTEHEAATVARFDAAPDADEACVEKVARAIAASDRCTVEDWPGIYEERARAAIDAMRPAPNAPQADSAGAYERGYRDGYIDADNGLDARFALDAAS
jgi:hypothetical protein